MFQSVVHTIILTSFIVILAHLNGVYIVVAKEDRLAFVWRFATFTFKPNHLMHVILNHATIAHTIHQTLSSNTHILSSGT